MKTIISLLFSWLFILTTGFSQTIQFADEALKQYIIHNKCVDTTYKSGLVFANDMDVDLNNDNEIQVSEALLVKRLELDGFQSMYGIKSLTDLNAFTNLNFLKVISQDSLEEVSNLQIDSLKSLWVNGGVKMRRIDISNMPHVTEALIIQDIDTLDYLNIQNGNVADYFSLFYTDNIKYACIDSILKEYNEVYWKMVLDPPHFTNCSQLEIPESNQIDAKFHVFPNPAQSILNIQSTETIQEISIYSSNGSFIPSAQLQNNTVDVSTLPSGVFLLEIKAKQGVFYSRFVKL